MRTVYCITKKVPDNNYVYVGTTSQSLRERFRVHKQDATFSINANNKLYKRMNEVGLDAWEIKPLFVLECDITKIREFEKKWMKTLEVDLNTISPLRTKGEYYNENKEKILQQKKKYSLENKDVIRQREVYRRENKEKIHQREKEYRRRCVQEKKFYCSIRELAFGSKYDLERYFKSKKHKKNDT